MRLLILAIILSIATFSYGQEDSTIIDHPYNCVTILNDKPIKPFQAEGNYLGRVIIQAKLDTLTMTLSGHKFIFADLYSKTNHDKKIELRQDE